MPNHLSAALEICGGAIASEPISVRRRDCESTCFAASKKNQNDPAAALTRAADRQKRSGKTSPRKTFIITGIPDPFDRCSEPMLVCENCPSCHAGARGFLYKGLWDLLYGWR